MRRIIATDRAPKAIGPYSQAVQSGDTVYLSGQIPLDPASMQMVEGDIAAQARRVFENLKAVCEAAGGSLADLVRVTIFLTDLGDFAAWHDPERLVGNLHRALAERRGLELGGPLDVAAAFGDMVAYNGGQPLRCLA